MHGRSSLEFLHEDNRHCAWFWALGVIVERHCAWRPASGHTIASTGNRLIDLIDLIDLAVNLGMALA